MTKSSSKASIFSPLNFFLFLSLLIWMFCFRRFISGELTLVSDALAYYEHFKFYFDQISHGVYPMWDHSMDHGIPIELYLRRIGSYNPFFFFILVINKLGIKFYWSYMIFMSMYYWLGMIGFFLIARRLLGNDTIAFLAYLLLMFSSLGTRLFDSYLLLTCIPIIWFFYFLMRFFESQQRFFFLGFTFTIMILATTYIPFYFLTIFFVFIFCFLVVYFNLVGKCLKIFGQFFLKNKFFVMVCLILMTLSFIPGALFFKDGKTGEVVLNERHTTSQDQNMLGVGIETITAWGLEEDIMYSTKFTNLRDFYFAIFYIPLMAYVILALGALVTINRLIFFLFLWGGTILLIFSHNTPIYQFLYEHVFYFKYFRNSHFYLWIILLPLLILLAAEQGKRIFEFVQNINWRKRALFFFVTVVHAATTWIIFDQGDAIITTYLAIGLSYLFFTAVILKKLPLNSTIILLLILLAVVIEPIEVYHYLSQNSQKRTYFYRYDDPNNPYLKLDLRNYPQESIVNPVKLTNPKIALSSNVDRYIDLKNHLTLLSNVNGDILDDYQNRKLVVYDRFEKINDESIDWEKIGDALWRNKNVAFVSSGSAEVPENWENSPSHSDQAQIIRTQSQDVKLLKFDVNGITVKTNYSVEKFLVYNDKFHSHWHVFINGKEHELYRANVAFKGVWLPAGENTVCFIFDQPWRYAMNWAFIIIFMIVFIFLLKEGKELREKL